MKLCLVQSEKQVAPYLKLHNSVEQLNNFQKSLNKNIKSKIKIEKTEAKLINKQNKDFKKKFIKLKTEVKRYKPLSEKNTRDGDCTTKHLCRIMLLFEEPEFQGKPVSLTELKDFTLLLPNVVNDGLKFLVKFNIIKEINDKGRYFYQKYEREMPKL